MEAAVSSAVRLRSVAQINEVPPAPGTPPTLPRVIWVSTEVVHLQEIEHGSTNFTFVQRKHTLKVIRYRHRVPLLTGTSLLNITYWLKVRRLSPRVCLSMAFP